MLLFGCGGDAAENGRAKSGAENGAPENAAGNAAENDAFSGPVMEREPRPPTGHTGEEAEGEPDLAPVAEIGAGSLQCGPGFQACGGLLSGWWTVEGTCSDVELDASARRSWGQSLMGLDTDACPDAVQDLTSRWSGRLRFESGVASDERRRVDSAELALTRECLEATFAVSIRQDKLPTVCNTLSSNGRQCASLGDACRCTVSVERPERSGTYGVMGNSVAVGSGNTVDLFEYCVEGDRLHWQEADSRQHLLLRRTGSPEPEGSSPEPR